MNDKRCLSMITIFSDSYLHVENCNLQSCRQKWAWTASKQLMNVNDLSKPLCISTTNPLVQSSELDGRDCSQKQLRWQCKDSLIKLKDYDLYMNLDKFSSGQKINLLSNGGNWSHWVKYTTRDYICSQSRKGKV